MSTLLVSTNTILTCIDSQYGQMSSSSNLMSICTGPEFSCWKLSFVTFAHTLRALLISLSTSCLDIAELLGYLDILYNNVLTFHLDPEMREYVYENWPC